MCGGNTCCANPGVTLLVACEPRTLLEAAAAQLLCCYLSKQSTGPPLPACVSCNIAALYAVDHTTRSPGQVMDQQRQLRSRAAIAAPVAGGGPWRCRYRHCRPGTRHLLGLQQRRKRRERQLHRLGNAAMGHDQRWWVTAWPLMVHQVWVLPDAAHRHGGHASVCRHEAVASAPPPAVAEPVAVVAGSSHALQAQRPTASGMRHSLCLCPSAAGIFSLPLCY